MTHPRRTLLRQPLGLVLLGAVALTFAAGQALAQGPAPEPAPPGTGVLRPEPAAKPPVRGSGPVEGAPGEPGGSPGGEHVGETPTYRAQVVQPPVRITPPPAATRLVPPETRQKAQGAQPEPPPTVLWEEYPLEPLAGQAERRTLPSIRAPTVTAPSPTDWTLLGGGLALVVLSLGATVLLTLTVRLLRDTDEGAFL